jgi:hypothetical protein
MEKHQGFAGTQDQCNFSEQISKYGVFEDNVRPLSLEIRPKATQGSFHKLLLLPGAKTCSTQNQFGGRVVSTARKIKFSDSYEYKLPLKGVLSLWFPSSDEEHAAAMELHRRVHEDVNGVGSPINFAMNNYKYKESYLQFGEKGNHGGNVNHLLRFSWAFTDDGSVEVR